MVLPPINAFTAKKEPSSKGARRPSTRCTLRVSVKTSEVDAADPCKEVDLSKPGCKVVLYRVDENRRGARVGTSIKPNGKTFRTFRVTYGLEYEIEVRHPHLAWGHAYKVIRRRNDVATVELHRMEIGAQDDTLALHEIIASGNDARIERLFWRIRSLGATWLRVFVYWHAPEDTVRLERVVKLVEAAQKNGLQVQMTLSGETAPFTGMQGANPDKAAYSLFVKRMVDKFVAKGVRRYSVWNEPNLPEWLIATGLAKATELALAIQQCRALVAELEGLKRQAMQLPEDLALSALVTQRQTDMKDALDRLKKYHDLRESARCYARLHKGVQSILKDANCQLLFGELSSRSAAQFLKYFGPSKKYRAHGLSLHPYQYTTDPSVPDGAFSGGVGSLDRIREILHLDLRGSLQHPQGKRVGLYLTEFGYHRKENRTGANVSESRLLQERTPPGQPEQGSREAWTPLAFERARISGARQMVYYHVYPADPAEWDTSIVNPDWSPTPSFASLQRWAIKHKYPALLALKGSLSPEDAALYFPATP